MQASAILTTLIIPGGVVSSSSIGALELGDGQQSAQQPSPREEAYAENSTTGKIRLERDSTHPMWLLTKHFNLKRYLWQQLSSFNENRAKD